jgi:hypothetical protein
MKAKIGSNTSDLQNQIQTKTRKISKQADLIGSAIKLIYSSLGFQNIPIPPNGFEGIFANLHKIYGSLSSFVSVSSLLLIVVIHQMF